VSAVAVTLRALAESRFRLPISRAVIQNLEVRIDLRRTQSALSASGFGSAWFALCVAFALHIVDEASTGFLAVYNPTVTILRERWGWFPVPPYEFREWLTGVMVVCGVLFCLTPLAARGMRGLRPVAWCYAILMFLNSLGHTLFSILGRTVAAVTFPRPAPGFYSSPFLFAAALWLMLRLRRTARVDYQLPTGV
jgi:hypothetical protein